MSKAQFKISRTLLPAFSAVASTVSTRFTLFFDSRISSEWSDILVSCLETFNRPLYHVRTLRQGRQHSDIPPFQGQ